MNWPIQTWFHRRLSPLGGESRGGGTKRSYREWIRRPLRRWAALWVCGVAALLLGLGTPGGAQEAAGALEGWRITPQLGVGVIYSDNIRLAPADEAESDLVLEVEPGVSMRKQGGRLEVRLDYSAQGLFYTNDSDASTVNHNLRAFSVTELYQDRLFVDAYGSVSQVPIASDGPEDRGGFFRPGNTALTGNQTTQANFGISPYWRQDFGGWVEALLRYRYDDVAFGRDEFDGNIQTATLDLASGRRFSRLNWNLAYSHQREERGEADSEDDIRERATGRASYQINNQWALLAEVGYVNDRVAGFENVDNGLFWGLGANWTPSRFFSLAALYGLNLNEVVAQWNPTSRTRLRVGRREEEVGVDPGVRWEGLFAHRTRYTTWSASYTEEVTSVRRLFGESLIGVGPDGLPVALDEEGQIVPVDGSFGLSTENFLRKRFTSRVTYQRGRSGLGFNVFDESREFPDGDSDENTYGVGMFWSWQFAPRTRSIIGLRWERDDLSDDRQNEYWISEFGLARQISPDMDGLLGYSHYRNEADPSDQSFRENQLNARLNMRF
ncbi:MAG: TIGR03016 family PEP-CTERM system-associated outer membrane protein [Candidatus Competibacteraceae bacterium]|nr:MAG: TIGR03016 family PEP-CTERM system-associated outer membrane protein [Candidatus Competibacteraceae bacterium]